MARSRTQVHEETLALVLMAMGDALIGTALSRSLGLPETAARDRAERMLVGRWISLSEGLSPGFIQSGAAVGVDGVQPQVIDCQAEIGIFGLAALVVRLIQRRPPAAG